MASRALVNPYILRWARERADLAAETLARKLGIKEGQIVAWEEGAIRPTFKQAQNFAHHVHVPFGYLFLDEPPVERLPIPDLRTVGDRIERNPSPEFRDVLSDVMRKWEWFSEYIREQQADPLPFVGRYRIGSSTPQEVAANISATLGINEALRQQAGSWEGFLSLLIRKADSVGICVLRNGVVGNNTHRPLSVEEFRGFVISDRYAPLIFLNGRDSKAAQIFTIAHELAHLWVGESGISNLSLATAREGVGDVERFCNDIAAEVLVPEQEFLHEWDFHRTLSLNADEIARRFRVSSVVAARRAMELDLIPLDEYWEFYNKQKEQWRRAREEAEPGGDFYRTLKVRNGLRFSQAVLASAYRGKLLFREAASLLGTSLGTLDAFARELRVR